MEFIHFSAGWL